jgi:hypothetical protein
MRVYTLLKLINQIIFFNRFFAANTVLLPGEYSPIFAKDF